MGPCKLLSPRSRSLRNERLPRRGEIVPCNAMLKTLRETTLCLRRLHMTPVHSQNEMFGLVRNERDGSYVIADMNPMRACWSEALLRWGWRWRWTDNWSVESDKTSYTKLSLKDNSLKLQGNMPCLRTGLLFSLVALWRLNFYWIRRGFLFHQNFGDLRSSFFFLELIQKLFRIWTQSYLF